MGEPEALRQKQRESGTTLEPRGKVLAPHSAAAPRSRSA